MASPRRRSRVARRSEASLKWRAGPRDRRDEAVICDADWWEKIRDDWLAMERPVRAAELGVTLSCSDDGMIVLRDGRQTRVALYDPFDVDLEHLDGGNAVKAPMHGKLIAIFVKPGDRVEKGQRLAIVEAMKMEHALFAPADGEVAEIAAEPGAQVAEGARLIVLKTEEQDAADRPFSLLRAVIDIADVASPAQTLRRLRFDRGSRRMDRGKPRPSPAARPPL